MGALKSFSILGIIGLTLTLLVVGAPVIVPIVISLFLWHLINALADGFQFFIRGKRFISITLSILLTMVFFWVPLELASGSIPQLIEQAPKFQKNLEDITNKIFIFFNVTQSEVLTQLRDHANIPGLASNLAGILASATGNLMLVLLYTTFLMVDQCYFGPKMRAMFPDEVVRLRVEKLFSNINEQIRKYLLIKTFLSILTGFLSYLIFVIEGIDFAEFWAVLIFFLNYIPTIGAFLGVIFPAFLALVQFETIYPFLIVFFGCGMIQFLVGNMLEPKMMGKSMNLSTFVIVLSLVVWSFIWGFVGAFLSVPMMVILLIIFKEFPSTKKAAIVISGTGEL
ncbi:AI-2E family transporter [Chlamydiales bacterium]|nr:AI-2E family transporter [Chlamydiales bacterium]